MNTEAKTSSEAHSFQAEVADLLRLMVHSVYSETDIFLRELVSNASDACDKLRYDTIANPALMADGATGLPQQFPGAFLCADPSKSERSRTIPSSRRK